MKNSKINIKLKQKLEELYSLYNKREFVHPDPLEFLYHYDDIRDREVVAIIASSLAYGRVAQILKSISIVLDIMTPSPYDYIMEKTEKGLRSAFSGFKHRFTTGDDMSSLLMAVKKMIKSNGSLLNAFVTGYRKTDENILPSLSMFAKRLIHESGGAKNSLIPVPDRGSACKRLNLFLRWMVRKDAVDPGGWEIIHPSKLIIPLDTHMYNIGCTLKMTMHKQAGMPAAIQITNAFKRIMPLDPVKYDFSLTRPGIRREGDPAMFLGSI
ncbi:MAG: TIGR02757 family protein [Deltaproteobacteria bacterium]|nr:TIGR02757 family protein [Deltaproteobacteria bacterium]